MMGQLVAYLSIHWELLEIDPKVRPMDLKKSLTCAVCQRDLRLIRSTILLTTICSLEVDTQMLLHSPVQWIKTRDKGAKILSIQAWWANSAQTRVGPTISMGSINLLQVKEDILSPLSLSQYWPSKKFSSNRHVKHSWNNILKIVIWTVDVCKTSNVIFINLQKEVV